MTSPFWEHTTHELATRLSGVRVSVFLSVGLAETVILQRTVPGIACSALVSYFSSRTKTDRLDFLAQTALFTFIDHLVHLAMMSAQRPVVVTVVYVLYAHDERQ